MTRFLGAAKLTAAMLFTSFSVLSVPSLALTGQGDSQVSYSKQIRPILQKRCQGCHQPASQGGKLILTTYQALRGGGGSGAGFKPGSPDDSILVKSISGNPPSMPKNNKPLSAQEIDLIRKWVAQGGKDDTPAVKDPIDMEHPPTYETAPAISALAYSPDGSLIAVSGYREVLLHKSDGSGVVARLVGRSPRIESVSFSPDGKLLAVAGGSPARFGEVQIWDVEKRKLLSATEISYDVAYGVKFAPDGLRLSIGCADNSPRILSVPDGKVLLKFDNHSDWTFATTWTTDNKHFLSTGRDRAIKLIVAENGSFVDDINTHTSAYRTMVRHPKLDQVLVAGDDGMPRLYQVFRTKARTMNQEDHNLLKEYERQPAQVNCLAYDGEGTKLVVAGEDAEIRMYNADGTKLGALKVGTPIYAVGFRPDGQQVAAGGLDGVLRIFSPDGKMIKEMAPVPLTKDTNKGRN
jgi:WD40 repeat protein